MADRATLLLVVGYVGTLAYGAHVLRLEPAPLPTPPAAAVRTLPPLTQPPVPVVDPAAHDAITERPLFNAQRRPPDAGPGETADAPSLREPAPIDGVRLTGVLMGTDRPVVLVEQPSGETRALHEGDRLDDWRIQTILDDRVVLASGASRKTLRVHEFADVLPPRSLGRAQVWARDRAQARTSRRLPAPHPTAEDAPNVRAPASPPGDPSVINETRVQ